MEHFAVYWAEPYLADHIADLALSEHFLFDLHLDLEVFEQTLDLLEEVYFAEMCSQHYVHEDF